MIVVGNSGKKAAQLSHNTTKQQQQQLQLTTNLFSLSNSIALESRVFEAALILKRTMQLRSPWIITEREAQRGVQSLNVVWIIKVFCFRIATKYTKRR